MKLTEFNLYIKETEKDSFALCIELPDNSRNYIHTQDMILNDCLIALEELRGKTIEDDCNAPYLEKDGTYFRIKMTVEPREFTFSESLYFHSRKLNLNDAVKEHLMLIKPTNTIESDSK
ncbi:hypothetical protein [Nitrososphaeria virus YSH_922147]|uniref:Uncharacterized protein n=1 Tax=Nitrososphaeria virus YSH_922147 TaxID=3071323 RepID=A0A976YF08_9CAUD|nr:hypothetical protein QKV94_gp01 [Yangshan Harbor Nitrososphaeria virus]UVF62410.1 hypothetical protein [Nitrososphaeria virus YSH_922147]